MALESLSCVGNGFYIECSLERVSRSVCGNSYQSNFKIYQNGDAINLAVLANQPIGISEDGTKFELVPEDVAELMSYGRLKIYKLFFLDARKEGEIKSKLLKKLEEADRSRF